VPRRNPTVPLLTLLNRRFPGLADPVVLIKEGAVLVNGVPAASPRTRVRADAAVRIRHPRLLRGTVKLAHALTAFGVDAAGAVALDLGAAAGGFTQALLDAGAARVYAVDAGAGQLRGWLRADPLGQVDRRLLAPSAQLIALVKPTFELRAPVLANQPRQVTAAVEAAARALEAHGWQVQAQQPSPILGAKGAVEVLLHASSTAMPDTEPEPIR